MPASASNLLVGAGSLWTAAQGTTEPLDTAVAAPLEEPWEDRGATDGGVTVTAARDYYKLRMDQTVESPGRRLTELDVTLQTNLAEPTLENWHLAMGDAAAGPITEGAGFASFDIGGPDEPGQEPDYLAVIFRGRAPQGFRRLVIIRKALSFEEVESEYKKDDQTFIPITFGAHFVSASVKSVHCVDERTVTP